MSELNLFGDPYQNQFKRKLTTNEKKKRRWENSFQKWSNEQAIDGSTHYGCCGFGTICDYCVDNSYGRPCVRALNSMLRDKRKIMDYDKTTYEQAFDGEIVSAS